MLEKTEWGGGWKRNAEHLIGPKSVEDNKIKLFQLRRHPRTNYPNTFLPQKWVKLLARTD